jgi:hypothetical protein
MDDEKEEPSEFKVIDRRQFTTEGDIRDQQQPDSGGQEAPPQKEEPPKASQEEKPKASQEPSQTEDAKRTAEQDPSQGVNFASFLLSLATTGMLKEKTEGNLSAEESQLLENVLYELRMKFMGKSKVPRL